MELAVEKPERLRHRSLSERGTSETKRLDRPSTPVQAVSGAFARRRRGSGTSIEVVRWYSAYAGYLDDVIDSVKIVEPMKSSVSSAAPTIVQLSQLPPSATSATAPIA